MTFDNFEHVRTWTSDGFRLELYDTCQTYHGKSILAYQFFHDDTLVFEGADFGSSPLHAIDGDETVAGLLTFLSLKPGDTDWEYFESYTPEQLAFAQTHGEELWSLAHALEEGDVDERRETFMQPQVQHGHWWEIDTENGTEFLPADLISLPIHLVEGEVVDDDHPEWTEVKKCVSTYCEGKPESVRLISGWGSRLSAAGYLDCTEWAVFDSEAEAKQYLEDVYGD